MGAGENARRSQRGHVKDCEQQEWYISPNRRPHLLAAFALRDPPAPREFT